MTLKRRAIAKTKGRETKRRRDFAEVGGRISEIGERRFQTKERRTERAAKAAKTGAGVRRGGRIQREVAAATEGN